MSDSISSTDRESKTQTAEEQEYNRLKEALNSNTKALEKFIASGNGGLLENSNALRQESTRLADYVKQLLNDRERASLSEDEEKALDKELEKLIVQIQHADAMTLMQNFHLDIGKAREIKELLERGDVDFQTRYNELSCWLDDDKIWFEQFCSRFPNSDHLAGIQKLKEEAESEFDDVTQSMKEMEEEEQAEESVADKSSFENFCAEFPESNDAAGIQDLQDEAQSKFEDVTQSMKEKEEEEEAEESVADKSSFENFCAEFPNSDYAEEIQDLQDEAQSKFEDVTQSMKEKEEKEEAKRLKTNFQLNIDDACKLKKLLERGDVDFQSRYDQLRNYLDDDKSSFKNFRALFPESNDAEEIQKLQEEAQSKFDDLTQLKTKKEEEQAEEFRTKIQSNIDDACEIKELLETGDDAFQSEYNQLVERLDDDNISIENFRAGFPESNHAAGIQKLQETAGSKFDDLTQLKKEKEPRSNLSLSSAFHTMLFGAVITLIGVYMVTGAQSDFLLIMIMVLTGLTFGIMLKRLLCC